jgi:UDP-2,4-diacetamido-2,4,6-trideoxy-beta-L-altropyranose hydrolase
MRIVFRTDASICIGTGHVMRCLTLADFLTRHGHECLFVCRDHVGNLGELIKEKGYRLKLLHMPQNYSSVENVSGDGYSEWLGLPWEDDASQSLDAIKTFNPDWLIVDHYALDAKWERLMSAVVSNIFVIDDLANRNHECALLLDQNLGRRFSDYDGLVTHNCRRLIGPKYAMLRPEFSQLRTKCLQRRKSARLKRMLVSFGGVDIENVTGQVLDVLGSSSLPENIQLDIIMGGFAPSLDSVIRQAKSLPFNASVSVNVMDMADRMCMADLSIGAAGTTSWERCCMGLPTIAIVLAENQRAIGNALTEKGAGILLDVNRIAEDLNGAIENFVVSDSELLRFANSAADVCDGKGVSRVAAIMSEVAH